MSQPNTPVKVLDYIKRSGALIAEAEKRAAEASTKLASVKAIIPDVVQVLVDTGRLPESLREKAAEQLTDPVKALEILANVAAQPLIDESTRLGSPEKTASTNKVESRYIGQVCDEDSRESGRAFMDRLIGRRI